MKIKDIDIPDGFAIGAIYSLFLFCGINALMVVLLTIKGLCLWLFDYKIIIFGIPL
jgi:hypothetical protein